MKITRTNSKLTFGADFLRSARNLFVAAVSQDLYNPKLPKYYETLKKCRKNEKIEHADRYINLVNQTTNTKIPLAKVDAGRLVDTFRRAAEAIQRLGN